MTGFKDVDEVAAPRFRDIVEAYAAMDDLLPILRRAVIRGGSYVSKANRDAVLSAEADLEGFRTALHRLVFDTEAKLQAKVDKGRK